MIDNGIKFGEDFKSFCNAERIQTSSRLTDTDATFAESTIRCMKISFHCYLEDYG